MKLFYNKKPYNESNSSQSYAHLLNCNDRQNRKNGSNEHAKNNYKYFSVNNNV